MKTYFLKIIFVLVFGFFCLSPFVASASATDNMSGFAWSSNIGWISFNCTNTGTCGASNYGVNKNPDGTLTGYAWSSNIGWIKFGGFNVSDFPTNGTGTQQINAKINNANNLKGWVKALSADGNGWDGWISLSGTVPIYGVAFINNNAFAGYVWGSDVVGWISFSGVSVSSVPVMSGTLTPSSTSCVIASGGSSCVINFSWTTINPVATSSVTSNTTNTGAAQANTLVANGNNGGPTPFTIPWGGRTFFLYNNGIELTTSTVASTSVTCVSGTAWNGSSCALIPINGGWSLPNCPTACGQPASVITRTCTNPAPANGGAACTPPANYNCPATSACTGGQACSSPVVHYKCGDGNDGTNQINSPSIWTWKCGATSCSEKKSPGYIEN